MSNVRTGVHANEKGFDFINVVIPYSCITYIHVDVKSICCCGERKTSDVRNKVKVIQFEIGPIVINEIFSDIYQTALDIG